MPRLLVSWLQIHPSIGADGRIEAGAHLAVDSTDYKAGRRWDPDTTIDMAKLNERLASSPVSSVAQLFEHVAALVARETGQPTSVLQAAPPPPPPEEADEGPAPSSAVPSSQ